MTNIHWMKAGFRPDSAFRRLWNQRRQISRLLKSIKAVVRANFIFVQGQLCLDFVHFGSKSVFLFNFVYIRHSTFYVQGSIVHFFCWNLHAHIIILPKIEYDPIHNIWYGPQILLRNENKICLQYFLLYVRFEPRTR